MKNIIKLVLTLMLTFMSQSVFAQIHESKSYIIKTKITDDNPWKKCQGFVRAGVLIPVNVSDNWNIVSPKTGFDLDLGFKLRIGRHGWYWGMDIALFTTGIRHKGYDSAKEYWDGYSGYRYEREHVRSASATSIGGRLGVSTFGWRARFSDFILDINAGIAATVKSSADFDDAFWVDNSMFGVEAPIGIGLAYKSFSLDFSLIVAPVPFYEYGYYNYDSSDERWKGRRHGDLSYNNFRISIGYLF